MVEKGWEEGQPMGGDGFTPGTQRFAIGLFIACVLLLGPVVMKAFQDPPPEGPRVAINGAAIVFGEDVGVPSVCGTEYSDKELVVALHPKQWKHPNPLKDVNCARSIKVTELESGKEKSVIAKVVSKCMKGCKSMDIALSSNAFKKLSKDATSLKVTWDFTD